MAKKKLSSGGIVYSTDPNFQFEKDPPEMTTLLPEQQLLKIQLETRHRAGKTVTCIQGFSGTQSDLEDLGKKLKNYCGTGGSVKEGIIIIQGDQRTKVLTWLQEHQYKQSKISGKN